MFSKKINVLYILIYHTSITPQGSLINLSQVT